jgi:hypothetical protein
MTKCVLQLTRTVNGVSYPEPLWIPELWDISWSADVGDWALISTHNATKSAFWKLQGEILGSMVGEC